MGTKLVMIDEAVRTIMCPHCEERQRAVEYATLSMSPRYSAQLAPVLRCRRCRHVFAVRED